MIVKSLHDSFPSDQFLFGLCEFKFFVIKNKIDDEDKSLIALITSNIIKNRYSFISYNGLSKKLIESLGESPFDNSFVIIDEAHNFISRVVNGSILARSVYSHLMNAKNMKIILLSGTPMINNPYEIATLINLIRGYMQVYVLTYSKTSKIITKDEIIKNRETIITPMAYCLLVMVI